MARAALHARRAARPGGGFAALDAALRTAADRGAARAQAMVGAWEGGCGKLDQYGMQYTRLFANLCNAGALGLRGCALSLNALCPLLSR
jgi:hypothetical protein